MLTFEIIYDHADFLIINKPCNISFHDDNQELGFFNQVQKQVQLKLWPVHRLDKMTSGIMVLAKNQVAAAQFGNLFEQKAVAKVYLAISVKKPKKKQGKIIGDMVKARNGSWKLIKSIKNPAITQFYSQAIAPNCRLYWLEPQTGKTHQLRVALMSVGAAILGDKRYTNNQDISEPDYLADRGYLHAYQLKFEWQNKSYQFKSHPVEGEHFNTSACQTVIATFEQALNQ